MAPVLPILIGLLCHIRRNGLSARTAHKFCRGMGRSVSNFGKFAARGAFIAAVALTLANCANGSKVDPVYGVTASPRVMADGEEIPKGNGKYRVGKPYVVAGVTYVPQEDPDYRAEGMAS